MGYVEELAKRGYNVVLISRTESKLKKLGEDLEKKYNISTRIIAIDFSKATESDFLKINEKTKDLNVGLIFNNVGVSHAFPESFIDTDASTIHKIVDVNIKATLLVTQQILPRMMAQKSGIVVNVSFLTSLFPGVYLATYAASKVWLSFILSYYFIFFIIIILHNLSKAFIDDWSEALAYECKPHNVIVEAHLP